MTDTIDAIVDAAIADVAPEATETTEATEATEATETTEATEATETTEATEATEAFPKKAVNALSRRDKKISKLQAENAQLKGRLQESAKPVTVEQSKALDESDFDTYGQYLAAEARKAAKEEYSSARQEEADKLREQDLASLEANNVELQKAREETIGESAAEAMTTLTDFNDVIDAASVRIQGRLMLPITDTVKEAIFEAGDDAAFAIYSLAKEGTLEDLNDMSLARAAMAISRHVDKGRALAKARTESTAPNPITRGNGGGKNHKSPIDMTGEEVMKWANT